MPQTTNMVRWRTHLYTLGHSLSYFQADFAGRIANRITQCGPAIREMAVTILDSLLYVAIFAVTALGLFTSISLVSPLPMAVWIAAYVTLMRYFVPRAQGALARERRGALGRGRAHRRQLHQHPDRQALRPRRGGTLGGAATRSRPGRAPSSTCSG